MSWLTGKHWDHAPRYCGQHRAVAPVAGGTYRPIGNNRMMWVCAACVAREKEREHERVQ